MWYLNGASCGGILRSLLKSLGGTTKVFHKPTHRILNAGHFVRRQQSCASQSLHGPPYLFWPEFKILSLICLLILATGSVCAFVAERRFRRLRFLFCFERQSNANLVGYPQARPPFARSSRPFSSEPPEPNAPNQRWSTSRKKWRSNDQRPAMMCRPAQRRRSVTRSASR